MTGFVGSMRYGIFAGTELVTTRSNVTEAARERDIRNSNGSERTLLTIAPMCQRSGHEHAARNCPDDF